MAVWPLERQGAAAVCERCELPVRDPRCDLRSEQGQSINGWRRVGLSDGGRFIRSAKMEGRNSYGGVWYRFYGKSPNKQTGLRASQVVMQLHPALDLLHHVPV